MPKQKITKKMILDAAFTLLRTQGYESLNARNIASQTGCSVQPIYSCYSNMSELMEELFLYTQQYLTTYIEKNADKNYYFASIGRCHIGFAREEKYLFCFLFLSKYMHVNSLEDIYRQCARQDVAKDIMKTLSISDASAKQLYLHMMLYTHGIASMIAAGAADIPDEEIHRLVNSAFHAFLKQAKEPVGVKDLSGIKEEQIR